jgi:hypothetical protein
VQNSPGAALARGIVTALAGGGPQSIVDERTSLSELRHTPTTSRTTFIKARTALIPRSIGRVNDSVNNWTSAFEDQAIFGMERTAQPRSA